MDSGYGRRRAFVCARRQLRQARRRGDGWVGRDAHRHAAPEPGTQRRRVVLGGDREQRRRPAGGPLQRDRRVARGQHRIRVPVGRHLGRRGIHVVPTLGPPERVVAGGRDPWSGVGPRLCPERQLRGAHRRARWGRRGPGGGHAARQSHPARRRVVLGGDCQRCGRPPGGPPQRDHRLERGQPGVPVVVGHRGPRPCRPTIEPRPPERLVAGTGYQLAGLRPAGSGGGPAGRSHRRPGRPDRRHLAVGSQAGG